jgi:hypothetical protein
VHGSCAAAAVPYEELGLGHAEWTEEEVWVLVPAPERLQRVVLYIPHGASRTAWSQLRAVEQLVSCGVKVVVSGEAMYLWPC